MGATSGDTGGAAIYGLRGKKHVDCYILYPKGRVSKIQERQMTTVEDGNIHCLRIEGTFDDCQDIVKACFNSPLKTLDLTDNAIGNEGAAALAAVLPSR